MKDDKNEVAMVAEAEGRLYTAPALEKSLDIVFAGLAVRSD
ncbi:hypothetical protein LJR290_006243 [Variovorax sp. LjRoot290]